MRYATAAALAVAVLVTGCGSTDAGPATGSAASSTSPAASTIRVVGTITVPGEPNRITDDDQLCFSEDGYDDIRVETQVTLADDAGSTLALADLSPGEVVISDPDRCLYRFDFGQVDVGDGRFFSVEAGRRGKVRFSREDLAQPIVLTLG